MSRKFTLELDDEAAQHAEEISRAAGKSVSQVVSDLLAELPERSVSGSPLRVPGHREMTHREPEAAPGTTSKVHWEERDIDALNLPPLVRSLVGVLKGADVDEEDYHRYLEEKYR